MFKVQVCDVRNQEDCQEAVVDSKEATHTFEGEKSLRERIKCTFRSSPLCPL